MIEFPAWYEGGFPDSELVVLDLAQTYLDLLTPAGVAVAWLSGDHTDMVESGTPIVRVFRGGMAAGTGLFDPAAVQIGVVAKTRADSWAVMEYLRQILLSYERGGPVRRLDGSITQISAVSEIVGPQQIPELNRDHRLVPATFSISLRRPQNLPDYAALRESLPL